MHLSIMHGQFFIILDKMTVKFAREQRRDYNIRKLRLWLKFFNLSIYRKWSLTIRGET